MSQSMQMFGVLLCWAVTLQAVEQLAIPARHWVDRALTGLRAVLALTALVMPHWGLALFLALLCYQNSVRWNGSLNGGSDGVTLHLLLAWTASLLFTDSSHISNLYVVSLITLSYFVAGLSKAVHLNWWTGEALNKIISQSVAACPSRLQRLLAKKFWLCRLAAGSVLLFELSFPLTLLKPTLMPWYLAGGLVLHFGNYLLFGLNRFFWVWLAAYPVLLDFYS